jgi:hypothetical protein
MAQKGNKDILSTLPALSETELPDLGFLDHFINIYENCPKRKLPLICIATLSSLHNLQTVYSSNFFPAYMFSSKKLSKIGNIISCYQNVQYIFIGSKSL